MDSRAKKSKPNSASSTGKLLAAMTELNSLQHSVESALDFNNSAYEAVNAKRKELENAGIPEAEINKQLQELNDKLGDEFLDMIEAFIEKADTAQTTYGEEIEKIARVRERKPDDKLDEGSLEMIEEFIEQADHAANTRNTRP